MRKFLVAVSVLLAVVGIGAGIALLAARSTITAPAPVQVVDNSSPQTQHAPAHVTPAPQNFHPEVQPVVTSQPVAVVQPTNINLLAATNTSGSDTNWEEKIDDIVGSDESDTNKVKKLYALFPKLPPDGQEEVAQHLSNLVDDEDYAPLGEMLKNDKLSEGVLDELLADVLNRPNNLKLPLLLDVAGDANHVKHEEAKDLLELYLGEDYGSDWSVWRQHMTTWMQQNPD
jgi:hypothetical protein